MMPLHELATHARRFAHEAHDSIKQVRKYSGLPYWTHTDQVAEIVASVTDNPYMIAAANNHDVAEDVYPLNSFYSIELIRATFGMIVAELVIELTDVFTKENYPQLNRKARKRLECERLGNISANGQTIKLADLIANTGDIVEQDPTGFAPLYLREKRQLLLFLTKGDRSLWERANSQADEFSG